MSDSIYTISDRLVDDLCALQPELATTMGVRGYDDRWADMSPAGLAAIRARLAEAARAVAALPPPADRWDELARRVLLDYVDIRLASIDAGDRLRDVNNIASPMQDYRETFDLMPTETEREWDDIIARLERLPDAIAGYRAALDEGARRDLPVPVRQLRAGAEQAHQAASAESWFAAVVDAYTARPDHDPARVGRVAEAAAAARAAFAGLERYLLDRVPEAPDVDGVGRDRYHHSVRQFLGSTIDPEETYEWGWSEVSRLWTRMRHVAERIDPDSPFEQVFEQLQSEPAVPPETFIELMQQRQATALAELEGVHFDIPTEIRAIDVKMAPPGGALGAYYTGPSEDFERRGTVWYAFGDADRISLFDEISTAYHEGFPGHHLQVGIQVGLADQLSRFHRMLFWQSGYGEGWALYAETLMDELGYLELPEYEMGYLAGQMLRACRVVIDIGLHVGLPVPAGVVMEEGAWTFERAVELLVRFAGLDRDYAESEVTRYLGWPGQAISYKVGERVILDLRDRWLADGRGDLKAFHARVLGFGPVGLDLLEDLVLD